MCEEKELQEIPLDQLRELYEHKKDAFDILKKDLKKSELGNSQHLKSVQNEKNQLLKGIEARLELINMIKKDILRMAYEESNRTLSAQFTQTQPKTQ